MDHHPQRPASTTSNTMKRSYDDANGSATSSVNGSPPSCDISPSYGRKRRSNSPPPIPNPLPPVPSVFTDAHGRIARIPTISRKVRACSACKKQKIRCDFDDGQTTCVRCKKMKLECVVNRSLQTILDEDVEWKHKMRDDTIQLQRAVGHLLSTLNMRPLAAYSPHSPPVSRTSSEPPGPKGPVAPNHHRGTSQPFPEHNSEHFKMEDDDHVRSAPMARDHSTHEEHEGQLFSNPMGSLYEVTKLRGLRGNDGERSGAPQEEIDMDFISRGLISLSEAQELFAVFRDNMNGHLYGMALVHDNLESARASSALLTSAIFTVTSLHMPRHQHLYRVLYPVFLSLVSTCMFDRYHRLDDVRGLCIGAFYLFEISWKLSGHAVRMATEMNLHQSFHKALAGSKEHYERARLWYLLYVCDHHFSIVHGRPPVMCDHEPMKKWEAYLQSPLATEGDYLVLSQVTLFTILTRIFHFFEDEAEHEISDDLLSHIPAFNERLDDWRETWHAKLPSRMSVVTGTPSKGVDLHYHFAKLQLNSLVLRGVNPSTVERLGSRRKVIANDAVASAIAVLSIILEEPAIRDTLLSAPLYLDTMVSCAASFLLKITAKWMPISFDISTDQVWALVERTIALLNSHSGTVSEFHIISQVANGLGKLLRKCIDISKANSPVDDSRLWNGSSVQENGGLVEQHSPHEHGVATYPVGHGQQQQPHPQQPSQQQQQQHQFWQSYQHQPGSSHDVGSEVLYSPQGGMHTGQSGQQPIYEVNGQYFPVPMGVFDFLSPQLPY